MNLLVVRHAKAQQESPSGRDADRPLAARGYAQAAYLAGLFAEGDLEPPDLILASPAVRTRTTALILGEACAIGVTPEPALFLDTTLDRLWQRLGAIRQAGRVMIVGHNPTLESFIAHAAGLPDSFTLRTGELALLTELDARTQSAALDRLVRLDD
jgi:phosphohistidine phosphatase